MCTDPLPDFTNFSYTIVTPPDQPKGLGWDKLKECERRLALYKWAERLNDLPGPQDQIIIRRLPHRIFLDDCLSAFLMTLEAALQFVGEQLSPILKPYTPKGEDPFSWWLKGLPTHDLHLKGLRTLRQFAAHVEIKPPTSGFHVLLRNAPGERIARPEEVLQIWLLPELHQTDLEKLRSPKLDVGDLPAWNKLILAQEAGKILEHALGQAQMILLEAENYL